MPPIDVQRILMTVTAFNSVKQGENESHSVMSNFLQPHGLQPARLLCPWNSPGKNTRVGCHALLQDVFPTQGLNSGLLHCRLFGSSETIMQEDLEASHSYNPDSVGELFMIADHRLWHSNISFSKASTSNIESLKFCIWTFVGEENKQIFQSQDWETSLCENEQHTILNK